MLPEQESLELAQLLPTKHDPLIRHDYCWVKALRYNAKKLFIWQDVLHEHTTNHY